MAGPTGTLFDLKVLTSTNSSVLLVKEFGQNSGFHNYALCTGHVICHCIPLNHPLEWIFGAKLFSLSARRHQMTACTNLRNRGMTSLDQLTQAGCSNVWLHLGPNLVTTEGRAQVLAHQPAPPPLPNLPAHSFFG